MLQDTGLLKAVVHERNCDEPRLVYADWLEEHGDADRAEFIRMQCRSASLPIWHAEQFDLQQRCHAIFKNNKKEWTKKLKGTKVRVYEFHRGFLEHVVLNGSTNFSVGEQLLVDFPTVRSLKINKARDAFDELLKADWLKKITWLNLTANQLGAKRTQQLVESPNTQQLVSLNLQGNGIKRGGMRSLFGSDRLAELKRLCVSGASLESVAVGELAQLMKGPLLQRLEWLSMAAMGWDTRDGLHAINQISSDVNGAGLRCFEFGDGDYSDEETSSSSFQPFCDSTFLQGLEHLTMTCALTDEQTTILCNHPASASLQSLAFFSPTTSQVKILLEAEQIWSNLKFIHVGNHVSEKLQLLLESPKCSGLEWLGVYGEKSNDPLAAKIAKAHDLKIVDSFGYYDPGDF